MTSSTAASNHAPEQTRLISFQTQAGDEVAWTGDDDAPYVGILGKASSDGVTGLVAEPDGANQRLATDSLGHLLVSVSPSAAAAASRYSSPAFEQSAIVLAAPGVVYEIRMILNTAIAADRYLMVFNSTALPANGDIPVWRALLPNPGAGAGEVWDGFSVPFACATGITVGLSTTATTFTGGGANALFEILYKAS